MSITTLLRVCWTILLLEMVSGFQMVPSTKTSIGCTCRRSATDRMGLRKSQAKLSPPEMARHCIRAIRQRKGTQAVDKLMVATNEFQNVSEKEISHLDRTQLNLRHFLSWATVVGPSPRVSSQLEDRYRNIFPVLAAAIAAMGPLLFGYALGYTSPCLEALASDNSLSALQSSTFASIINIGAVIAGLASSQRIETLGRKPVVLIASLLFFLGFTGVFMGSGSYPMLLVGRLVTGFAAGVATVSTPMYIAEISPRRLRGFLGSFYQLSCTLGILLSYSLGLAVGWREMALVGSISSLLFASLSFLFLPESPVWLERKGFSKRANAYADKLGMEDELSVSGEEELLDATRRGGGTMSLARWQDEWESIPPNVKRSLVLAGGMILLQQLCGINTVIFFSGQILASAGIAGMANFISFAVALTQVVVTAFSATSVDSMGRKKLLVGSGAGMTLGMALMVLNFALQGSSLAGSYVLASSLASVGLIIYIASFSFGWGPVPWLMVGELFPSQYRSLASAMSSVLAWGGSFCMTQFFGTLLSSLGQQMIFTGFTVACAFSVLWVLAPSTQFVETMGKSLEEIQEELSE